MSATEFKMDFSQYEMTEEQKFLFDLQGFLLVPDVFDERQVAAMKQQVYLLKHPEEANGDVPGIPGGASEVILSNPVVKGVLKELIGPDFRLDSTFPMWRERGVSHTLPPHQGGPMRNPHFHYHVTGGQIFSGLTRMVVELNPVGRDDGGTVFLPGSHKANFPVPRSLLEKQDRYDAPFQSYEATAGSVIFFSENTCHAGPAWRNPDHARAAIFFAFCNGGMRWHRSHHVAPEVIERLGPEARWYFRDVWQFDNEGANAARPAGNVLLVHDDGTLSVSP